MLGARVGIGLAAFLAVMVGGARGTQDAVANGDTRTLSLYHNNTKESLTVTFRRNGQYDSRGLQQLNWFLRDWRRDEPTRMDPRLFDTVWEVYREVGSDAADPREFGLPLAQYQFDAPAALQRGRQEQPAHAGQGDGLLPARRVRPSACAPSACGSRTAASAIIPTPTRPSCISTSAACAPGRA